MPCGTKLNSNKNAKSNLTLTPDNLDYYTLYSLSVFSLAKTYLTLPYSPLLYTHLANLYSFSLYGTGYSTLFYNLQCLQMRWCSLLDFTRLSSTAVESTRPYSYVLLCSFPHFCSNLSSTQLNCSTPFVHAYKLGRVWSSTNRFYQFLGNICV